MSAVPSELTTLTLAEAADLIAARELSPVELTRAHLHRIDAIEPRLNCFITLLPESALAQAREAEDAIRRGNCRGALHGIPIALKDLYETKGVTPAVSRSVGYSLAGVLTRSPSSQTMTKACLPTRNPRPPKTFFWRMPRSPSCSRASATRAVRPAS